MFTARLTKNFFLFLVALTPVVGHAQATVLASIKPLQLIAAALTDGVSTPQLLIPSNQSPHNFSLRPSDVAHLAQADIVLWIGPGMETYLTNIVAQEANPVRVIETAALPGITLLDLMDHSHEHASDEQYDPHLWLNTSNAVVLAIALHDKLVTLDSAHAAKYDENLARFTNAIAELAIRLRGQFVALQSGRFAVFHNGTQYFEDQIGLNHQFVIVPDHEIQPGIRHLLALRTELAAQPVSCLFVDINANEAMINTVFQDHPVRRVSLDPLGDNVTLGTDGYVQLITTMAAAIEQCLSPQ